MMSELYSHIDRLCKARGTNITALCKEAKVARAALSELHMGRTKTIKLETAAKLAGALRITVDELMGAASEHANAQELENAVVVYGRDGRNKVIRYTPEQMRQVEKILDALQSDDADF